jgi:hypothetical protein
MSLVSWKKEFYPKPADKVSKKNSVAHSLQKWKGLLKKNLKKHKLEQDLGTISGTDDWFTALDIDSESCALCHHYMDRKDEDDYSCVRCPLYQVLGSKCDEVGQPYNVWHKTGNARPMIRALEKCL